jgi:Na+/proline symporter
VSDIARALPHVDPALLGHDMAYPAMLTFLPAGVLGLMVAGLLGAYVSTISTHLNWGTSYLVHDLYRRFLQPGRDERHYVLMGRIVTALLMVAAALFTLVLQTARDSFNLLLSVGAGTGLLYLLRWFWWRINAWSEIAAMASSFLLAAGLFAAARAGIVFPAHQSLILTVAVTTVVWLAVTWATAPTDRAVLQDFYRRVRPAGPGWTDVRRECGGLAPAQGFGLSFAGWVSGCATVYTALFGTGHWLLGNETWALVFGAGFLVSAALLIRVVRKAWTT